MNLSGTSLRAAALVAAVGALLVFGPSAIASAGTPSDGTGSVRITEDAPDNREF